LSRPRHAFRNAAGGAAFRVFAAALRALPRAVGVAFVDVLAVLAFDVFTIRRCVAIENVERHVELAGGRREAVRVARQSYRVIARTFLDLIRLDRYGEQELAKLLSWEEMEAFVARNDHADGAVIVGGHFGNWELLVLGFHRRGMRIHVLAADQTNEVVNDAIRGYRARAGIRTLSPRRGLREAVRVLSRRECVGTLMDQDARRAGVFSSFLGELASTHAGMVSLAIRLKKPLLIPLLVDEGRRYRLVYAEPWRAEPAASDERNLQAGIDYFNRFLEEQVRRYPGNFFWAHRRWKTRPPSETRG
jgi:KDO2-lipid IV(A) lauroyltransferase